MLDSHSSNPTQGDEAIPGREEIISDSGLYVSSVFGVYDYLFQWEDERISLGVERRGALYVYYRRSQSGSVEKIFKGENGNIILNPVEPLNLPKEITKYLEFHFTPVILQSESEQTIYLTFPVEIGVFLQDRSSYTVIDIFSFSPQKYSLYGTPNEGVITRHVDTEVFDSIPQVDDPLATGVMELTLKNSSRSWVELTRAVFDNISLNLYYGDFVAMKGQMEIFSKLVAETRTISRPLQEGMKASINLFVARQISLSERHQFMMEYGVGD